VGWAEVTIDPATGKAKALEGRNRWINAGGLGVYSWQTEETEEVESTEAGNEELEPESVTLTGPK